MEGNISVKVEHQLTITMVMTAKEAGALYEGLRKLNSMLPNDDDGLLSLMKAISRGLDANWNDQYDWGSGDE